MTLLHSYGYGLLTFWALQFLGTAGLAWKLPRKWSILRLLCIISAIADIVEFLMNNDTNGYALVYWLFRILELNLMVMAACQIGGQVIRVWRYRIWIAYVTALAGTLANGLPHSNTQMHIYQTFMLMVAGGTALFIAGVGHGFKTWLVSLSAALACILQLICTLLWRYVGYDANMWFVAWISGLVFLGWSVYEEQRA